MPRAVGLNFHQATTLIKTVCEAVGSWTFIEDARKGLQRAGVLKAIKRHDDVKLFDWLMTVLSFQGVSDAAAASFMELHGTASAIQIRMDLAGNPICEKLGSYWSFAGCGYRKTKSSCNNPRLTKHCPLPRLDLRNGSLNQAAYSLFMFMRDVADDDLVGWIDSQLDRAAKEGASATGALIEPLSNIHGLSFKVLSMALADLLLAGDPKRLSWIRAGAQMIAVDTLVHNWLHRTGILRGVAAEHVYGPSCYSTGHCADIIRAAANQIDARDYNTSYPEVFPRWVQHALWSFCSASGLNLCNGNRIDDRHRCNQRDCILFEDCARLKLGRKEVSVARATA